MWGNSCHQHNVPIPAPCTGWMCIYIISRHAFDGMDGSGMAQHGLFGSAGGNDSSIHKCAILNNG